MGVIKEDEFGYIYYTPICEDCGIQLCWSIEEEVYNQQSEFWNQWKCKDCNPNYSGALKNFLNDKQ